MQPFDRKHDAFGVGPKRLIVVGPPGTGKTYTALESFLARALQGGVDPEKVLCCSYSVAAATEIRQRAAIQTGVREANLRESCSTIHSEALRRVKALNPDLQLYDGMKKTSKPLSSYSREVDSETTEGGKPNPARESALRVWDYCRTMLRVDDDFVARAAIREGYSKRISDVEILHELNAYREEKRFPLIDFTDMLTMALESPVGRSLDLLLIDEAQDCSPLQWKLIEKWERQADRIVVVGDPDQAIHEWMGAAPKLLLDRMRSPEWKVRRLDQSHRVPRIPHAAARAVIAMNKDRIDAPYEPNDVEGEILTVDSPQVAADWLKRNFDMKGETCFVLARSTRQLNKFAFALNEVGIPFVNQRGVSPWNSAAFVAKVHALYSMVSNRWCEAQELRRIVKGLKVKGTDYFVGKKIDAEKSIPEDDERVVEWGSLPLLNFDAIFGGSLDQVFRRHITSDAFAQAYINSVKQVGADVALLERPRIVLTTMHSSKGREADVVILDAGKPYPAAQAYEQGLAEPERRVLYVGLTRTKGRLIICGTTKAVYEELEVAVHAANQLKGVPF